MIELKKCLFFLPLLSIMTSCSKKLQPGTQVSMFTNYTGAPDYSQLDYWAAHPWKWDPSDSVPKPLLQDAIIKDTLTDVFFIHPTTLTEATDERVNAELNDVVLNTKTDNSTILYQASVFNENSRVFCPRYRQAHIRNFFTADSLQKKAAFDKAYADIRNAFLYYLQHWNNNRPFVIAAHSQGTVHAARLLQELIEGTSLQNRLICAYLLGMPVRNDLFRILQPCTDSNSTGCIITWRSYKKGYTEPLFVAKENFKAIVTNPLTWTTTEAYAEAALNTGGMLRNFNQLKKGLVDAQVHGNVLWTSKPKFFGSIFLRTKNYHIADINFFYLNIRENLKNRIAQYWKR